MNQTTLSITAFLLLLLWSVVTIVLTITIVGLFVLIAMMEDNGWFTLPHQIIDRTINPKPSTKTA
jgi:cytochrome c-type biogenesis protein CcmE